MKNGCGRKCHKTVRKRPIHFVVSRTFFFYNGMQEMEAMEEKTMEEVINEILEEVGLDVAAV